jgi:hypothetical protein
MRSADRDVVAWFAEHYPEVKATTVRANIVGLTENDRSRHHHAWLAKREPLFVGREDGALERFDANDVLEPGSNGELESEVAPSLEFALAAYLEDFLLTNWDSIDWGRPLELWESAAGEVGHQLATPVGRLDFLGRDTRDQRARRRGTQTRAPVGSGRGPSSEIHGLGPSRAHRGGAGRRRPHRGANQRRDRRGGITG